MAQKIGAAKYVECSALKDINIEAVINAAVQVVNSGGTRKKNLKCVLM